MQVRSADSKPRESRTAVAGPSGRGDRPGCIRPFALSTAIETADRGKLPDSLGRYRQFVPGSARALDGGAAPWVHFGRGCTLGSRGSGATGGL